MSGGGAANQVSYTITFVKGAGIVPPSELGAAPAGDSLLDVALSWKDNSADEEGFTIERKTKSGTWAEIKKVAADAVSYADSGLALGEYAYRVRAYKGTTYSGYSNEAPVNVIGVPWISVSTPKQGDILKAGAQYEIVWTTNRVTNIDIAYTADGLEWKILTDLGGVSEGDANWGKFVWTVPDTTAAGVKIRVRDYTEHARFAVSGGFSISPDAAARKAKGWRLEAGGIRVIGDQIVYNGSAVRIYDSHGRLIDKCNTYGRSISIKGYSRGVYFVEIIGPDAVAVREKIVVR
jgi:hypothetical protein